MTIEKNIADILNRVHEWITEIPHGDNCFVSSHYAGDPGDQCNCGKDGVLEAIEGAFRGFDALTAQSCGYDIETSCNTLDPTCKKYVPRCDHNYINGECKKCGCISAGE